MSTKRTAIISMSWVGALRASLRGLGTLRTVILARLLSPTQFGIYGIAALALGLLEILTETGINVVIVQDKRKNTLNKFVDTAWVISIVRGAIISLIIFALAKPITQFFDQPQALLLVRLISVVPLIRGFINPSIARFQKHMEFYQEFWFRLSIVTVDAAVAIIVTLLTQNPIGLVFGLIASALLEVVLSWWIVRPLPKFTFDIQIAKDIIHRGKWITIAGITNYAANRAPDISIGRIMSTADLGIFQLLYKLIIIPIEELNEVINRVFFPLYVNLDERSKLKRGFTRHLQTNLLVTFSASIAAILFADPLIPWILGSQWQSIVPLVPYMCIFMGLVAITAPTNPVLLSYHQQSILSITSIIKLVVVGLLIIPLTQNLGVLGAITSLSIAQFVIIPIRYAAVLRSFKASKS